MRKEEACQTRGEPVRGGGKEACQTREGLAREPVKVMYIDEGTEDEEWRCGYCRRKLVRNERRCPKCGTPQLWEKD